ncbi:MAG: hypothetical protein Q7T33_13420 [Dehalococcoidia bacterium]|nr:hypothetical protein [Dehalococcoidia bacterium]
MTVCIAALSTFVDANSIQHPVIILASDRMITARRIREYEFADQTKSIWYRDNLAVLMSGSVDSLLLAYQNACERVKIDCSVKDLVKALAEEIQSIRRRDVESLFLQRYNLTLDNFIARQKEWTPDFFERLNSLIADDEQDLGEVIVAGFDGINAHIYTIEGAGWERAWDGTGFCAIGIGAEHAEAEFAHALYSPKTNWIEAMRITFFAKKRAEEAPGVGTTTDLWYITSQGPMAFWPQSKVVQELNSMYYASRQVEFKFIREDAIQLGNVLVEEIDARTPRAATEAERKEAEAKAEEGDAATGGNPQDVSGGAPKGESED